MARCDHSSAGFRTVGCAPGYGCLPPGVHVTGTSPALPGSERRMELVTAAADGVVDQTIALEHFRLVQVTTIKDHRMLEGAGHHVEIRGAEFFPLGADGQGIGTFEGLFLGTAQSQAIDRKSTRLNSSHVRISYAVFCLKKKKKK